MNYIYNLWDKKFGRTVFIGQREGGQTEKDAWQDGAIDKKLINKSIPSDFEHVT